MPYFTEANQTSREMSQPRIEKWLVEGSTVYSLNKMGVNKFSALVQGGYSDNRKTSEEEIAATVCLIAAAPELLGAIMKSETFIRGFEGDELQEGIGELIAEIRAAIEKATNRQLKPAA